MLNWPVHMSFASSVSTKLAHAGVWLASVVGAFIVQLGYHFAQAALIGLARRCGSVWVVVASAVSCDCESLIF